MSNIDFFEHPKEQSKVKHTIVTKYFEAWANVVKGTAKLYGNNLQYIDLFAGRGVYDDGTESTPILILKKAIENPDLRKMLVTIFNDSDPEAIEALEDAVNSIPNINKLKHKPQILNEKVGEEIVKIFEDVTLVPTLLFADPWGYKGLTRRPINSVLKDWGCDCIFSSAILGLTWPLIIQFLKNTCLIFSAKTG